MVKVLEHLKGCEDPKLKHLAEFTLQLAAADAREAVDQGPELASPYVAVNFLHSVQEALQYASEHPMEKDPSAPQNQPDIQQNLKVVESWLQKHQ